MAERVLLADDDPHLLSALRRQLGETFDLTTAASGGEAIKCVQGAAERPFAVVVCDMRMPGMDGIETLKKIREVAPETVRMMLTGNADQQTAIQAINHGNIFRFFTKPCPAPELEEGINDGIAQFRLVTVERDLLERTLAGSLKVLVEIGSMNDPVGHRAAERMSEWVHLLTTEFRMPQRWQLETAATLLAIGQVMIPPEVVAKQHAGERLTEVERSIVDRSPEAARNLVANIPRLEKVAEILYLQDRGYDGSGFPADGPVGEAIPYDARVLKILKDLAVATEGGPLTRASFAVLDKNAASYDPRLLIKVRAALESTISASAPKIIEVPLSALRVGQTILSDIRQSNGHLVLAANTKVSEAQIERLRNLRKIFTFVEPIKVRV